MTNRSFAGFPSKGEGLPVPASLFTDLLPVVDDINELKLILYLMWLIKHKRGLMRWVMLEELQNTELLVDSMVDRDSQRTKKDILAQALQMAVKRGVMLQTDIKVNGKEQTVFLLNTENERKFLNDLNSGHFAGAGMEAVNPEPVQLPAHKDIYSLYEQNIGLITPIIADELRKAEDLYPREWLAQAFREAAELNKRNWRYIVRILERWAIEGKHDGKTGRYTSKEKDTGRYTRGKFGHMVKQ